MKYIHKTLQLNKSIKKTFIIGNVSCDLDSFLCSYLYSLGQHLHSSTSSSSVSLSIPIINCNRGELSNRFDIDILLKQYNIPLSSFFYINDPFIQSSLNPQKTHPKPSIILVDHNKPDLSQSYLSHHVTEIYDHHQDELHFPSIPSHKKTIITPLGSCSTIILDKFFTAKFPSKHLDPLFSVSSILVDTENFNPCLYKKKWIDRDSNVYHRIMSQVYGKDNRRKYEELSDEFYRKIFNAKNDVKKNLTLGIEGVLLKDKKQYDWNNIKGGWSAMQIPLNVLLEKYQLKDITKAFDVQCSRNGYRVYMINYGDIVNGKEIKAIALYNYSLDDTQFKGMVDYLRTSLGSMCFSTKELIKGKMIQLIVDPSLTRKYGEPILRRFYNAVKH